MLYIGLGGTGPRTVRVRSIDSSTQAVGDVISILTIQNVSENYTSDNSVLAYRPNYSSHSGGNIAIVFINIWKLPFRAAKVIGSSQPASCLPLKRTTSDLERHLSKHLISAIISASSAVLRALQHMDLESEF